MLWNTQSCLFLGKELISCKLIEWCVWLFHTCRTRKRVPLSSPGHPATKHALHMANLFVIKRTQTQTASPLMLSCKSKHPQKFKLLVDGHSTKTDSFDWNSLLYRLEYRCQKGLSGVYPYKSAANICKLRQWRSQQPSCLDYIVLDDRLSVIDCNIICECSVTATREGSPLVQLKQPATQILTALLLYAFWSSMQKSLSVPWMMGIQLWQTFWYTVESAVRKSIRLQLAESMTLLFRDELLVQTQ